MLQRIFAGLVFAAAVISIAAGASAEEAGAGRVIDADPANLHEVITGLQAGDTVRLADGEYSTKLELTGVKGAPEEPVTITAAGDGAVFAVENSALMLRECAYVTVEGLRVPGARYIAASMGGSEGCTIRNCRLDGGIYVSDSPETSIISNEVRESTSHGIRLLGESDGARIIGNRFIDHFEHAP